MRFSVDLPANTGGPLPVAGRRLAAAIGEELARRIVAQGVVIVDVFIAQGDARDTAGPGEREGCGPSWSGHAGR